MRRYCLSISLALACLSIAPSGAWASGGWNWPLEGNVITPFAQSSDPYASGDHRGIDIAAAQGTAIVAPIRGKIRWTGTLGSGGKIVSLTSSNGQHVLSFLHLSAISVARGQAVAPGTKLGLSGSSGDLRGIPPHLHFGVRVAEAGRLSYVDPLALLSASGKAAVRPPQVALRRRQRRPAEARRQTARPARPPAVRLPAAEPLQQRAIRPAAAHAERVRRLGTNKRGPLERERAVERASTTPRESEPALSKVPAIASEALEPDARPGRRTPLLIGAIAVAAVGLAALLWWRRCTVAPVLPAHPPNTARLHSVEPPPQTAVRKAL